MMVGAKYANRKNGQVVVIKDVNEKFKTVIVDFPNGSNRKYSLPSFNKSFKALEDENNKQEEKKAATTTEKAEKPAKETSKQSEKTEKKEKKFKKVDNSAEVSKILDYVFSLMNSDENLSVGVPRSEEMKFRALRCGKKQFCKLMWSAKSVRLYFREEGVAKVSSAVQKVNYNLPYLYIVTKAENSSYDNIKKMFKIAVDSEKK